MLLADRAKQIKTVAIVNEDPTEKLIRELRQENDRLRKMLEKGAMDVPIQPGMSEEGSVKFFYKYSPCIFKKVYYLLQILLLALCPYARLKT